MKMIATALGSATLLCMASAHAAPTSLPRAQPDVSLVEQAQAFRRDCVWINNGWRYKRGASYVVCRPNRPSGRGWVWHREGDRYGWWDPRRRAWHHRDWR